MGTKQQQCESYWDRGHRYRCCLEAGHKGLHKSKAGRFFPAVRWRLNWEDTSIAKRAQAANERKS